MLFGFPRNKEKRRLSQCARGIGDPYDNGKAERFLKTLKEEDVDGRDYRNIKDARQSIESFLEEVYNRQRPHSALDYRTPAEFEAQWRSAGAAAEQLLPRETATCP